MSLSASILESFYRLEGLSVCASVALLGLRDAIAMIFAEFTFSQVLLVDVVVDS